MNIVNRIVSCAKTVVSAVKSVVVAGKNLVVAGVAAVGSALVGGVAHAQITNPSFTDVADTVGDGFNIGLALAVAAAVALLFFGGIGALLVWYEAHVSEREKAQALHEARTERDGYLRYAEAKRAGPLDIVV